jgi:hypothetical protein
VITVVVPVSPVKEHPEVTILSETMESIRFHHPDAEILLTFDGVRAEQDDRYDAYEEAIRRILWKADKHWGAVCPFIFEEHRHQSGMMRAVIDQVRTPLLMYVESDCPIVTDEPIDWLLITNSIECGEANLVRLHHEAAIPNDHQHMMHGGTHWPAAYCGPATMLRTSQWSQRPHVASTAYYRRILESHFTPESRCFVEDLMHGVVDNAYRMDGINGWLQHRLHIYHPDGGNIKRSYTLDARAGEPKYDDTQVW